MIFQAAVQGTPQCVLHRAVDNDCIPLTSAWVGRVVLPLVIEGGPGIISVPAPTQGFSDVDGGVNTR